MVYYKGANQTPSLISRLRGSYDHGWKTKDKVFVPPPEIQIEAADELQRMEYSLTLHKNYLVGKGLLVEFLNWCEKAKI